MALVLLSGLTLVLSRPAGATTTTAPSSVTIMREDLDPAEGDVYWTGGPDQISATNGAGGVQIAVSGHQGRHTCLTCPDEDQWTLQFAAKTGDQFGVGQYPDAASDQAQPVAGKPMIYLHNAAGYVEPQAGDFQVRDYSPDLSRLWITYRDYDGQQGQHLFGEIRIGEPASSSGVLVAPSAIDWPDHSVGDSAARAPIAVFNLSTTTPLSVSGGTIGGTDNSDFDLSSTAACRSVAPGGSCLLDVGDTPGGTGLRGPATVTLNTSAGPQTVLLSGHGTPAPNPTPTPHADGCPSPSPFAATVTPSGAVNLTWAEYPSGSTATPAHVSVACSGAPERLLKTVVRAAAGTTPPATPTDGFAVYSGRDLQATTAALPIGTAYSFAAFAEYARGSISTATLTVGTVIFRSPASATSGRVLRSFLTQGQIFDATNTYPVCDATVELVQRDVSGRDKSFGSGVTDGAGNFSIQANIPAGGVYRLKVSSGQQSSCDRASRSFIGSYSPNLQLQVYPEIGANAFPKKIKHGHKFKVTATLSPAPGTLYLEAFPQGKAHGKWIRLAAGGTDAKGRTTFQAKLPSKGKWLLRVRFSGTQTTASAESPYYPVRAT